MQLDALLLHDKTRTAIHQLLQGGAHALVLAGPAGSGKLTLGRAIAAQALGIAADRLSVAPYFTQVEPINNTLTIDQVRSLQRFLRLKTTGTSAVRRVALLVQAHTMNTQAQNALLKTLEEPPLDTMLILTVDDTERLLETVRSRVRIVRVLPPPQAVIMQHFAAQHPAEELARAYAISAGNMGLLSSMLAGDNGAHDAAAIDQAKQILGLKQYDRLLQIDALAKDKDQVAALLTGLKRVCRGALQHASASGHSSHAKAWHRRLTAVDQAGSLYARGANTKLLLTHLFLQL